MEINYVLVVAMVTYILGTFTKTLWPSLPHKYIPLQNILIGITSALICYFTKLEPSLIEAFTLCFSATLGAGGMHDLVTSLSSNTEKKEVENVQEKS